MTICHRTGWPANPWVFMSIEQDRWPSHQANGDFRASSASECAATPQPAQPASLGGDGTAATGPDVAGVTAPGGEPPVSTLPSAGEPIVPVATAVLLALGGLGLYVRRLGRGSRLRV